MTSSASLAATFAPGASARQAILRTEQGTDLAKSFKRRVTETLRDPTNTDVSTFLTTYLQPPVFEGDLDATASTSSRPSSSSIRCPSSTSGSIRTALGGTDPTSHSPPRASLTRSASSSISGPTTPAVGQDHVAGAARERHRSKGLNAAVFALMLNEVSLRRVPDLPNVRPRVRRVVRTLVAPGLDTSVVLAQRMSGPILRPAVRRGIGIQL